MSTPSPLSSRSSSVSTPPNLHQNTINPEAKWLVQKYGGTCVGKFDVKIAKDIVSYAATKKKSFFVLLKTGNFHRNYIDNHKVAVVCSARSGSTKALGTTNLLLRAASEALKPRTKQSPPMTPTEVGLYNFIPLNEPPLKPTEVGLFNFIPLNESPPAELPEYHVTVDLIRSQHLVAARSSVRDPEILKELQEEIERDCEWLRNFLLAAKVCFTQILSILFVI